MSMFQPFVLSVAKRSRRTPFSIDQSFLKLQEVMDDKVEMTGTAVNLTVDANPVTCGTPIHFVTGHPDFYEVRDDGSPGDYRDTTLVMPRQSREILCVFDNPGKWLLHCHTPGHQASGMKTWVEVL